MTARMCGNSASLSKNRAQPASGRSTLLMNHRREKNDCRPTTMHSHGEPLATSPLYYAATASSQWKDEILEVVSTISLESNTYKEYVDEPGDLDICCGRGKGFFKHPGNKLFQDSVRENVESYTKARSKNMKSAVVTATVNRLLEQGLRFLKRDPQANGRWYVLSTAHAHEKTGHAIRDHWMQKKRQGAVATAEGEDLIEGQKTPVKDPDPPTCSRSSTTQKRKVKKAVNTKNFKHRVKTEAPGVKKRDLVVPRERTTKVYRPGQRDAQHSFSSRCDIMPEVETMSFPDLDIVSMSSLCTSSDYQFEDYEMFKSENEGPLPEHRREILEQYCQTDRNPSPFEHEPISHSRHLLGSHTYGDLPMPSIPCPTQQDGSSHDPKKEMTWMVSDDSIINRSFDYDFNVSHIESSQATPILLNMDHIDMIDVHSSRYPPLTRWHYPHSHHSSGVYKGNDNTAAVHFASNLASSFAEKNSFGGIVSSWNNQAKPSGFRCVSMHSREGYC